MGESLMERRFVNEEALRGVKFFFRGGTRKGLPLVDGSMPYQLVGEVTAHQGCDGYGA